MRSLSLRKKLLERDVRRIALHESGHAVANHLLRYGTSILAVEKARWKHGGQLQGWCYPALKWKRIDTSDLGRRLDEGICFLAGYATEIVCGLLGDYELEDQAATIVMTENESGDLEKHFRLTVDLWRRFPEFRRAIADYEPAEAGLLDAVRFLQPYRKEIEQLAALLAEKFWASKDGYGALFPEDVERIMGAPPSGMIGVQEAARLLGIHRKKVPALPGVVTFAGVYRVPASLCTKTA